MLNISTVFVFGCHISIIIQVLVLITVCLTRHDPTGFDRSLNTAHFFSFHHVHVVLCIFVGARVVVKILEMGSASYLQLCLEKDCFLRHNIFFLGVIVLFMRNC